MKEDRVFGSLFAEIPLPSGEGGAFGFAQGKLRPGEGRVMNASSSACNADTGLGVTSGVMAIAIVAATTFSAGLHGESAGLARGIRRLAQ
jgi:hypothetical protein